MANDVRSRHISIKLKTKLIVLILELDFKLILGSFTNSSDFNMKGSIYGGCLQVLEEKVTYARIV